LGAAVVMVAVTSFARGASATLIDFNLPVSSDPLFSTVTSYQQNGFEIYSGQGDGCLDLNSCYVNWINLSLATGDPSIASRNADGATADLTTNWAHMVNWLQLFNNNQAQPFSFNSIDLADPFNETHSPALVGEVDFTFYHSNSSVTSSAVYLANVTGLQHFTFNEQDLIAVSFMANSTSGGWLQFDDMEVNAVKTATPLPAALPLFATGLGGLGLLGWRRRRRAQTVT